MKTILITDLSEKVLKEIYSQHWSKNYKDALRCQGVNRILRYFQEKGISEYDELIAQAYVQKMREQSLSGTCNKTACGLIRKSSAFMQQVFLDGHISTEPLPRWSTELSLLFSEPVPEVAGDLNNIHTLVYLTRQAMLKLDLGEKSKGNYTYDGFRDILRFFQENGQTKYSKQLLNNLVVVSRRKYCNNEIGRSKYQNIRKTVFWTMEYHETHAVSQRKLSPYSFEYVGESFEELIHEYTEYSVSQKLLKESSITIYALAVRRFFRELEHNGKQEYSKLNLPDVSQCIITIGKSKPCGVNGILQALRSFARFISERHPDYPDISPALIGSPAKHRRIYEGYTQTEAQTILRNIDRNTVIGKRDYAMIMLSYNTGLRGTDIANLGFENINWEQCEIRIIQEKTGIPLALPLDTETGNAIADYILHGRPECNSNNIFLRTHRPYTKLNDQSLWTIFSKYSIPALGKSIGKKHGPHAFRRGIGARMLDAEIPHTVMSDVLGHSVPEALTYYTAVSLNGLRLCAGTLDDIPVTREELL